MNERQSRHDSQYKVVWQNRELSCCGVENTKKPESLTDSEVQTFLVGGKNQYKKRKPRVKYSVAWVLALLVAENENLTT